MSDIRPRSGAELGGQAALRRLTLREGPSRVPRLVLAGEANSGKTTLVNFLLQAQLLVADIVPNTPCPTLLCFGETAYLRVHFADGSSAMRSISDLHRLGRERAEMVEVHLPSPVLRRMEIIDLPGFVSRADAEAKSHWLKAADIAIWCTPATQAWKASEQAMWLSLAAPRAGSFLVLTHRDLLSGAQLADVAERMARETQRYFSHWTAIATPQAIAARNPRGEIVARDVWTSAGVEDFMKKLMDLLQSVVPQRRDMMAASDPAPSLLPEPELPDPLAGFAQMRQRLLKRLSQDRPPQQAASLMAAELDRYSKDVLTPWIAAQKDAANKVTSAIRLMNGGEAEIASCLLRRPSDPAAFTPAMILDQLQAELAESLNAADEAALS